MDTTWRSTLQEGGIQDLPKRNSHYNVDRGPGAESLPDVSQAES